MIKVSGVQQTLKALRKHFDSSVDQGTQKVAKSLVNRLKEATPVDTGEAKDGWVYSGGAIRNNVEHIGDLNAGSSQQAPTNFVERTALSHPGVKPNGLIVTKK